MTCTHYYQLCRLGVCLALAVAPIGCSKESKVTKLEKQAKAFYDAGEPEKAKISYLNLLKEDPGNAAAIAQLARLWTDQGAPLRALPYLMKSRELLPKDVGLRNRLAMVFMTLGDPAQAHKESAAALEAAPDNGEALIMLAETCRTPEERDAVRQIIDAFPNQDSADRYLAGVTFLLQEKNVLGAEEAVARAEASDPKSVRALVAAGALLRARNDLDGAEQKFKAAAELASVRAPQKLQYAEFVGGRGRLDEAREYVADICKKAPDYIPAWMLAARLAGEAKDYDGALAALGRIMGIDADNYPARLMEADLWVLKQDFAKAVSLLEQLETTHPRQPNVKYQLARAHLQNGDSVKAATSLRSALTLSPDFSEAMFMLAQIDLRSGRPEEVVPAMKRLLEKRPGLIRASTTLAEAYQMLGRPAEAIEVMARVADADPKNIDHQIRLSQMLAQTGRLDAARTVATKALETAPTNAAAVSQLVDLDLTTKDVAAAQQRVTNLIAASPDSAAPLVIQGRIHAVQQAWPEAEQALRRAIEVNADQAGAQELLIQVLRASGKLPQAIEQSEAVLARTPNDTGVLREAAILYVEKGEYAKAAAAYEKLLSVLTLPDAIVLNNLATIYASHLNRDDRAYELVRQARELRSGVAAAPNPAEKLEAASIADTLGWLLFRRGEYAQALSLTQEGIELLSKHPEANYHFGMAAAAMGQNEAALKSLAVAVAGTPEFVGLDEARQHFRLLGGDGAPAATSAELAALTTKSPGDVAMQLRLAEAHEREQNLPSAATAYAAALARNSGLTVAARKLAELYAGPLNDPAKALENARKARQLAPNDPQVASLLGSLVLRAGEHPFAYDLLREATRNGVREPAALVDLATAAYSVGQVEDARTAMKEAQVVALPAPLAEQAATFLALTAPVAAGGAIDPATAEETLKKTPEFVPALMVRAAALTGKNEPAQAAAVYEKILTIYPAFTPAQSQLAALLAEDPATLDRAYELATQVRKALPNDPGTAELLGRLSYHRKDYRYALELFAEAAGANTLTSRNLYFRGLCQKEVGDLEASRVSLEQALAAGLPAAEAAHAATLLEAEK